MNNEKENALPKIGYLYHYPKIEEPKDRFRLDIFISSIPTDKHFDVIRCHVFVKTPKAVTERLTISHPWVYEKEAELCAGFIIMEDRKGKKEEAFTFGGNLTILEQEMQTIGTIKSSAPILEISGATPLHKLFTEELQIIFAKRQAAYSNHFEYEALLCQADPFELYLACLRELTEKLENFPPEDEDYLELLIYLHSQEHRLREAGLGKKPKPTLDEIFAV
ncbi:MAG: hypothetical protein JSV42_04670 [Chloroflexota bacterium]|nr:MAG: hypothetical protein JSV42_04670 [Chloroflexota bacterium]